MSTNVSVEVRPLNNTNPEKPFRAHCTVTVGGLKIHNCRLFKSNKGEYFVGMPQEQGRNNSEKWYDIARITDKDLADKVNAAAEAEYKRVIEAAKA